MENYCLGGKSAVFTNRPEPDVALWQSLPRKKIVFSYSERERERGVCSPRVFFKENWIDRCAT